MLDQKMVRELLHYNYKTGVFTWKVDKNYNAVKGQVAGSLDNGGYVCIVIACVKYRAQNLVWLYVHGYFSEFLVDHKDRDRTNNILTNLREVTRQCNIRNSSNRKDNKSGVKGVSLRLNGRWAVQMSINNKVKYLGYFTDFEEAVCHRLAAEQCVGWEGCDSSSPAYQYLKQLGIL